MESQTHGVVYTVGHVVDCVPAQSNACPSAVLGSVVPVRQTEKDTQQTLTITDRTDQRQT